jgi:MoaA/NifB/PqqE/SkfB family radical SAM enzyme
MSVREQLRDARFAAGVFARRPFQVLLQVTNRCNMQCNFCGFWSNGVAPSAELTLADFAALEAQLTDMGTFIVSIEGGEPLLRPDLVDIVSIFGVRHIPLLYTNGWYVDDATARALWSAGLAQVGVSIDYADAARHDRRRGVAGAFDQAWHAVELLRDAAPHRGKAVHVMTVLMDDNTADLDAILTRSKQARVGHCATLLSSGGFRRAPGASMPSAEAAASLANLWAEHTHFRMFGSYLRAIEPFLRGGPMPTCHAGVQSFNVDHVGNVSPCIEKIDRACGNIKREPLRVIHQRLVDADAGRGCQQCWTACRGFAQALGDGGTVDTWRDLAFRMRSL